MYKRQNILITGGSGYVGTRLTYRLLNNKKIKIVNYDISLFGDDHLPSATNYSYVKEDLRINFEGAFHIIKKVLPNLKKDNGASVVFISSVAANTGLTFHSSIAASKSALEGFARSLSAELAPKVAVNCIAPSLTKTPLTEHLVADENKLKLSSERHPLNAIGDPIKIARVIYNLFSAKENWITGQTIRIDGGLSTLR